MEKTGIDDETPADGPFAQFARWMAEAQASEPNDPNGMARATVGADGWPSVRMVLLKGWDADGFVFYTNLESRKGSQLAECQRAALLFHWKSLRRQIRIEHHLRLPHGINPRQRAPPFWWCFRHSLAPQ